MSIEVRKTGGAPVTEFSTGIVVPHIEPPPRVSERFLGKAIECLKRALGIGGELEVGCHTPLTIKVAQVGQQVVLEDYREARVHDLPVREALEVSSASNALEEEASWEHPYPEGFPPVVAHIEKKIGPVEDIPFSIRVSVELRANTPVELIEKVVTELRGTKIRFDGATKTLHFGYEPTVIRALSAANASLGAIVGVRQYTIFDEYMRHYVTGCTYAFPASGVLDEAEKFFATVRPQGSRPLFLSRGCSEQHVLAHCLEDRPGICIGECHEDSSPKDFLCEHLSFMVRLDVTTLFIEHLPSESLQDELDQFLALPEDGTMPKALSIYLDHLSAGMLIHKQACGYKDVIVAAKAAGIQRIVCVDTHETYTAGSNARYGVTTMSRQGDCMKNKLTNTYV